MNTPESWFISVRSFPATVCTAHYLFQGDTEYSYGTQTTDLVYLFWTPRTAYILYLVVVGHNYSSGFLKVGDHVYLRTGVQQ